jgi:hypothetical protein
MKKNISRLFTALIFFLSLTNKTTGQTSQNMLNKNQFATPVDGAWQRVHYFDGKTVATGEPKEFVVLHDGFFSSVGLDSTNRWSNTHAGIYELSGNTFKASVRYSSHPERIASIQGMDYELKGDTRSVKWYKKLIDAQGKDVTAEMPKGALSKYVRAKK